MAKKKKTARARRKVYVFVDTNIFLDFYRDSSEATLSLLERLKPVRDRVICTYQVEMEFMKNRQRVLVDSLGKMKSQKSPQVPAIFADSGTSRSLKEANKQVDKKAKLIRKRIVNLLRSPNQNDVVYQTLLEVFTSDSAHVLTRDMVVRNQIKRRAFRRFIMGYPPRKQSDTSMGDALNWEWIVHCGQNFRGKIIIVSRDSDFGSVVDGDHFLNDQLMQEYRDRVGKRKSLAYTTRLSDALKEMQIEVPQKEVEAERKSIDSLKGGDSLDLMIRSLELFNQQASSSMELWLKRLTRENPFPPEEDSDG